MDIKSLAIPELKLITPDKYEDDRGYFVENFRQDLFEQVVGAPINFVQENYSFSKDIYTVRGLHAQSAPHAQGKLVRCVRGRIRDAAVDIRPGSPSFGQAALVELSAATTTMLWVPEGFLHGFVTLEADTEVSYKCTNYFAPGNAINVNWLDKDLSLDWGVDPAQAIMSEKDKKAQSFKEFELEFRTTA